MRLSIDKPSLVKALAHVASVVERRNTIPILSNVLLDGAKNEVKLTATDLDMEVVETVPCKSKGEGATTVPAHMLYDIVRKLPEGAQVQLELAEADVTKELAESIARAAVANLR